MVNGADVNTSVIFTKIPVIEQYSVMASVSEGNFSVSGDGYFNAGEQCTLSYQDLGNTERYNFDGWYDYDTGHKLSSLRTYKFKVISNISIEARFSLME